MRKRDPQQTIYDHSLLINLSRLPSAEPIYQSIYMFGYVKYLLCIYPDAVCIHQYTAHRETPWIFSSVGKEVNDALRKAYLLYALRTGKGLVINKITLFCDNEKLQSIGKREKGFPYAYSMLGEEQLTNTAEEVNDGHIFGNKAIMEYLTKSNRSQDQNDKRIIALFAFLQGRSREYEADRFLNYWTAINAVYSYLNVRHNKKILTLLKGIPEEVIAKHGLTQEDLAQLFVPYDDRQDMKQINAFVKLILAEKLPGVKVKGGAQKEKLLKDFNNVFENLFERFARPYMDQNGKLRYGFERLYTLATENKPMEEIRFRDEDEKAAYSSLCEWAESISGSLFILLSIDEPYYMRNYYIHGSETPLLISNNYHLHLLSCLNYFMDRLLMEYIPVLFDPVRLKDTLNTLHMIIYNQSKGMQDNTKKPAETVEKKKNADIAKQARKIAAELGEKEYQWMNGKEMK